MEITNEDYFNIKYNKGKDVLEIHNDKKKNVFRRHKFMTGVLGITLILAVINLVLIYKFFAILFTIA